VAGRVLFNASIINHGLSNSASVHFMHVYWIVFSRAAVIGQFVTRVPDWVAYRVPIG